MTQETDNINVINSWYNNFGDISYWYCSIDAFKTLAPRKSPRTLPRNYPLVVDQQAIVKEIAKSKKPTIYNAKNTMDNLEPETYIR